jgi:hypothetical protein
VLVVEFTLTVVLVEDVELTLVVLVDVALVELAATGLEAAGILHWH